MPLHDFRSQRLFVDGPLAAGTTLPLDRAQANYLLNVLRMADGDALLVFDGASGEWRARLVAEGRKKGHLTVEVRERAQTPSGDLHYLFAPLKSGRLEYMVQKAVEMGVSHLQPVMTERTQAKAPRRDKMEAQAIEAAEQCGVLALPTIGDAVPLAEALAASPGRQVVFCDERAAEDGPIAALSALEGRPVSLLIGPEGGFSDAEREAILARGDVARISLGPRILRADTAAVAALALVQATIGDWRGGDWRAEAPPAD